jgi:AcrR family transcriptional regulator
LNEVSDLRVQIIRAAKRLLVDQGYHGLSMREVAGAVGVSKAALYYHFQDKEQMLLAILSSYLDDIEALIDDIQAQSQDSRERIYLLVARILQQPAEQRAIIRLASQEMPQLSDNARKNFDRLYHRKFLRKIEAMIASGIQRGDLRTVDPNVATWTLLGMMYPYFYPAHAAELPAPNDVAEQLATIFLDGLSNK